MKITWLGHSCFRVETEDYAIVLDPYGDGAVPGLLPVRETAQAVICSHEHFDHNARACVTLAEGSGQPIAVTQIDTWHDEVQGAKRGPNKITILTDGRTRIAHFGDIGCELTPDQVKALSGLDAALIPVGGFYTIGPEAAAALVRQIRPHTVIPMHYSDRAAGIGFDEIGGVEAFAALMDPVCIGDGANCDLSQSLPEGVLVLRPANAQN